MSVRYKLVLRKDLTKGAAADAKKYYASVNNNGTLGFNEICEAVSAYSTASRGDVMVVLDAVMFCMKNSLLRGEIVQLGDLGNFQINVGSKGADTTEAFKVDLIRTPRIVFRPGVMLKDVLNKVSFERIGKEASTTPPGGGGETPEDL